MALFNHVTREVHAKLVYFGPACGGKETSLTRIFRNLPPESRSNLKAMSVQGDRMLFFDFRPSDDSVAGYRVRVHIYTAVGEVRHPATWKTAFRGADGVVFVVDSDPSRQEEHLHRLNELQELLGAEGSDIDHIPLVMQYNRRDHPDAVALEELQRTLNRSNVPGFPTVATDGEGVQSPLSCLTMMVLANVRSRLEAEAGTAVEEVGQGEAPPATEPPSETPSGTEPAEPEAVPEGEAVTEPAEPERQAPPVSGEVEAGESREFEPMPEPSFANEVAERAPAEAAPGDEICLEITGRGKLEDGRLTIPVTVTTGADRGDFQLIISLAAVESRAR